MRVPFFIFFKKYRHWKIILALLFFVLILIATGSFFSGKSSNGSKNFYTSHLLKLSNDIKKLNETIKADELSEKNIDTYNNVVSDAIGECHALAENSGETKKLTSQKLIDAADKVKRLCDDFIPVGVYGQQTYRLLGPYMLFEPRWPESANAEAIQIINSLSSLAQSTNKSLDQINNSNVNDPALPELKAQLTATQQQAQDLAAQAPNISSDQYIQLQQKLQSDKTNFMNARRYYWMSTIQSERLQTAVNSLYKQFSD